MHSKQGLGAVLAVVVVYQRPWRSVHASRLLEAALTGGRDPDGGAVPFAATHANGRRVVAYCVHGHGVSQDAVRAVMRRPQ